MAYDRASAAEYDGEECHISRKVLDLTIPPHVAWKPFGGPSWSWDGLLPYFKKAETFHPASVETPYHDPHTADTRLEGTHGPVQVRLAGCSLRVGRI